MQTEVKITTVLEHDDEVTIYFTVQYDTRRTRDTSFEEYYTEVDWFEVLEWTIDETEINDEVVEEWLELNQDKIKSEILWQQ